MTTRKKAAATKSTLRAGVRIVRREAAEHRECLDDAEAMKRIYEPAKPKAKAKAKGRGK